MYEDGGKECGLFAQDSAEKMKQKTCAFQLWITCN